MNSRRPSPPAFYGLLFEHLICGQFDGVCDSAATCRKLLSGWVLLTFLLPAIGLADMPATIHRLEARLDRDFGYVMGETLRQTVLVETDANYQLEDGILPRPGGAVNDWLEVRDAQWRVEQERGKAVHHIVLSYQVFKGVRNTETLAVPALPLRFHHGDAALQTEVPSQPFTLNPLISPQTPDEAVSIRGSRVAPTPSGIGHAFWLSLALAGLAGTLAYGAWRLGLPPFRNRRARPFEQACQELRKLRRHPPSPESYRYALRVFHAALNERARRTVLEGQLPRLFREHPELAPLAQELEAFFLASHGVFFSSAGLVVPSEYPLSRLENLCLRCRTIERRHG